MTIVPGADHLLPLRAPELIADEIAALVTAADVD